MRSFYPLLSLLFLLSCKEQTQPVAAPLSTAYKKGLSFLNTRPDSAYYYLNKAATESKDSLPIAQAYNRMGFIQNREGDYYGGQESVLTSLKYLHADRQNDQYCLVSDYNVLGNISLNLKNYDAAIDYYAQAYRLAKDERSKLVALNNTARAYQEMAKYNQAAIIYDSILPKSKNDKKEYARVLCNLASVRWQKDSDYRAAQDLVTALQIRKDSNDEWGLNSSYAHLADFYSHSKPDSALGYAKDMYAVASRLNSPDDQLEALDKLIRLSPAKEVKPYFLRYRTLKDSLEIARNNAKNQFALIRYESEKNKSDNLRLQQENAERRVAAFRQQAIFAGVTVVLAALVGWTILGFRRRRKRLEMEKQAAIREERIQTSQRVHDIVANGLYRVMSEIEHGKAIEKESLLDKIETLYIQSRDISYEAAGVSDRDFHMEVTALLTPFANSTTRVSTTGNDEAFWTGVPTGVKNKLAPILQELMVNMAKHSSAKNVFVRFEQEGNRLLVEYLDDGVGLPADVRMGNGLTSTGNRIAEMNGRISFEENVPKGLKIRIHLPID